MRWGALALLVVVLAPEAAAAGGRVLRAPLWPDSAAGGPGPTANTDGLSSAFSQLGVAVLEFVVEHPIWTVVAAVDALLLWFIIAILRRQWEIDHEDQKPSGVGGARRRWRTLAALVRLASAAAPTAPAARESEQWGSGWESVGGARRQRRDIERRGRFDLGSVIERSLGPVLVTVALILIAFEAHAFFAVALPSLQLGPCARYGLAGAFSMALAGLLVSYAGCILTDPGKPDCQDSCGTGECKACARPKPSRCHHCRTCRRCVLVRDHHCPWINNCVGLRNHRLFRLFLLHGAVAATIVAASLAPSVVPLLASIAHVGSWELFLLSLPEFHALVAFGIALFVAVLLVPFSAFHCWLAWVDLTTTEYVKAEAEERQRLRKDAADLASKV